MNKKNVSIVTLGCSKNEVDSEIMQSVMDRDFFTYTSELEEADVIIVNTCGFIEAAKEESIDTIIEMAQYKVEGNCKHLILAGCLAQRYSNELIEEIPEVDAIMGTGNIKDLNDILNNLDKKNKIIEINNIDNEYLEGVKREVNSPFAYLRISEGCDNLCTYCIIPQLRGKHRSRKMEDILTEANNLVEDGVKEIIIIAQNTSDYGIDLYGEFSLYKLLDEMSKIEGLYLIRLLYLYPDNIDDKLIDTIKNNNKIAKYVDMPLQHASDNVLKLMNRRTSKEAIKGIITKLRDKIPEMVIRTTFIVGFPGETESDYNELYDFIKEVKFDKLGVFTYSREENTPAYSLPNQVNEEVKDKRRDSIMELQLKISENLMSNKLGNVYHVMIEEFAEENLYVGRSFMDAPEIDGVVYVNSSEDLEIGDIVKVKITEYLEYDLLGELTNEPTQ